MGGARARAREGPLNRLSIRTRVTPNTLPRPQVVSLTAFVLDTFLELVLYHVGALYIAWELRDSKRRAQLEAALWWLRVEGWSSALVERMMLGIAATHEAATNYVTASPVYGEGSARRPEC